MSKRVAVTLTVAMALTARVALACSCFFVPLCQRIDQVQVLFVGTALETNDDHKGFITGGVWYRFSVEESFKGLTPQTLEVIVDPAAGSSCQSEYTIGKRYFISSYGSTLTMQQTAAFSVSDFPTATGSRPAGQVVMTGNCSGSLPIEDAAKDLAFARQYFTTPQPARIFGFARRNASSLAFDDYPGLKGVTIAVTGQGRRYTRITDEDGRFEIRDVAPGIYRAQPTMAGFKPPAKEYPITVPAHGCGVASINMTTSAGVSGKLLQADGSPAQGAKVEYVYADPAFREIYLPYSHTQTDSQGRFQFRGMPNGQFYVGVNIESAPDTETPFLPTYWPGERDLKSAGIVSLAPNEQKDNLAIRLGPRAAERIVVVKVLWPDGGPAVDTGVSAKVNNSTAAFQETDANGEVKLRLLEGLTYRFNSRGWMTYRTTSSGLQVGEHYADAEEVTLAAGSGPAEISLVLTRPEAQR